MALTGEQALAVAKKYTRETIEGMGAVKGEDGFSPIITENANNTESDYRLDITTAFASFTTDNLKGENGEPGTPGNNGKSAYQIWLDTGNTGTEADFLVSLKGNDGTSPTITENADNNADTYKLNITDTNGSFTTPDLKGIKGDNGETPYIGENGNWWYGDTDSGVPIPNIEDLLKYVDKADGVQDTPVGHIIAYMGNSAPKHYLVCDGTEYQIAGYPYLTQHFMESFGSINYFGGDGEATFAVPDLRGEFLRGSGTNGHENQGNGEDAGIHQDATIHPNIFSNNISGVQAFHDNKSSMLAIKIDSSIETYRAINFTTNVADQTVSNGNYTSRPTNTSVLYCIKYEPTYFMQIIQTGLQEYPNAGFHNSIYRGKFLGNSVTAEQYAAISAGTFDGLYIGDYWTIGGVNWRIAAFDYYLNCGDTATTVHHAMIVPDTILYNYVMNDTNTTEGGYVGSKMYKQGLTQAKTMINEAFSGHVLNHRVYLVNAVSNGAPSAGVWCDSEVELMNEQMVYGGAIFSPIGNGSSVLRNERVEKSQLPLFAHEPNRIGIRVRYWLRDAISARTFTSVHINGHANPNSPTDSNGVRPSFSIY